MSGGLSALAITVSNVHRHVIDMMDGLQMGDVGQEAH